MKLISTILLLAFSALAFSSERVVISSEFSENSIIFDFTDYTADQRRKFEDDSDEKLVKIQYCDTKEDLKNDNCDLIGSGLYKLSHLESLSSRMAGKGVGNSIVSGVLGLVTFVALFGEPVVALFSGAFSYNYFDHAKRQFKFANIIEKAALAKKDMSYSRKKEDSYDTIKERAQLLSAMLAKIDHTVAE